MEVQPISALNSIEPVRSLLISLFWQHADFRVLPKIIVWGIAILVSICAIASGEYHTLDTLGGLCLTVSLFLLWKPYLYIGDERHKRK